MSALTRRVLANVVTDVKSGFACGEEDPNGIFQVRMNNIARSGKLDLTKKRYVPASQKQVEKTLLGPGDILFNATNSPDLVGKTLLFSGLDEPTVFSNHFLRLRTDEEQVTPAYLAHLLQAQFQRGVFKSMCRQWVNQATVSRDSLLRMDLPVPPITEQHEIVSVLDHVDALRIKRQNTLSLLDDLAESIFADTFGNVATNDRHWNSARSLGEVAFVGSGITKGRKVPNLPLRKIPYMAVVNVQERHLDLSVIKEIDATEDEINRYRLLGNDLLLTEGGDPDKLGRGTLWRNELPECIHQNHIFRVRVRDGSGVDPVFLNWLIASARGRRYFLRSAKQTTGIASINATQLKNFPLLTPPIEVQQEFSARMGRLESWKSLLTKHLVELDALFSSLQHRAFYGEWRETISSMVG
ncbi:restriction endonuclease subunit S [Streptomyces profundus]|uniref:restriction endonuclease subunit S n=1 Tax=Streptomyces profundus TaxID=2867410 RepID=UPI001D16A771|nr:restriction endonuclease subunit S [Streptomyces sp. MA3_2.13]UED85841.1 restriction endonuclease subunit S [Streptomyces sp. MA3_2.13]